MEKKPISRQGFENLIAELKDLKENQRPEILKVVQWARSLGDLSENADYSAAKEKQRQIDKRIQFIEDTIENSIYKKDLLDIKLEKINEQIESQNENIKEANVKMNENISERNNKLSFDFNKKFEEYKK